MDNFECQHHPSRPHDDCVMCLRRQLASEQEAKQALEAANVALREKLEALAHEYHGISNDERNQYPVSKAGVYGEVARALDAISSK